MSKTPSIIPVNPAIGKRGDIHVYVPENAEQPVPFVLGIHGGGWSRGDQTAYAFLWERLAPLGIGLVLASYRLSQEAIFPAAYEDLLQVLKWLRENAEIIGLDPTRCLLFGGSAGGHLAMLIATRAITENRPRPELLGVVNYCGIMDVATQYTFDTEIANSTMAYHFIGGTPEEKPMLYRAASPIAHVHSSMPPVWMAHGTADPVVPYEQSLAMVKQLRELKIDVIFHEARGLPHTMTECDTEKKASVPFELLFEHDMLRFIHRTLKQTGK